jgi:hypothetical protein
VRMMQSSVAEKSSACEARADANLDSTRCGRASERPSILFMGDDGRVDVVALRERATPLHLLLLSTDL